MAFDFKELDRDSYLLGLDQDQAIKCVIEGDFTFGEEVILIETIQKGMKLPMSSDSIMDVLIDCMDSQVSVDEAKRRLIEAA